MLDVEEVSVYTPCPAQNDERNHDFRNSIQDYGAVVVLEKSKDGNFSILIASDNSEAIIGHSPAELFDMNGFADILAEHELKVLIDRVESASERVGHPTDVFNLSICTPSGPANDFACVIHAVASDSTLFVCEFEPQQGECLACRLTYTRHSKRCRAEARQCRGSGDGRAMDVLATISRAHECMSTASTLKSLLESLSRILKDITGHQDIFIHRYDKHWGGRVIARDTEDQPFEYSSEASTTYNLPEEYRELYENLSVHVHVDQGQKSASLVGPLDRLDIRPVYLQVPPGTNVTELHGFDGGTERSRVSIPLKVSGKIWGLIICHSRKPVTAPVSFLTRSLCRLVGDLASRTMENMATSSIISARGPIMLRPDSGNRAAIAFATPKDLLGTFKSDFAISSTSGIKKFVGLAKAPQEGFALFEYLQSRKMTDTMMSLDFSVDLPDLYYQPGLHSVVGLLYIPLSLNGKDFVVFFRDRDTDCPERRPNSWTETDLQNAAMIRVMYCKFGSLWKQKVDALEETHLYRLLMSNSSHEFRTLLNAINNYLDFAGEGQLEKAVSESVMMAKATSQSLLGAVTRLLGVVAKGLEP